MACRKSIGLLFGTMLGWGACSPAFAQESASAEAPSDIIVTARRMEERLQDVPISISVFNQQQLDDQNIYSATDLAQYTPSLSANGRYGSDYASFAIRGFTQEARTTASVGVYFADVITPRAAITSTSGDGAGPGLMFDLQNVQVLKGPQGTLFGRNTTGGAILLVPRKPTDRLEGYVEGSFGNHDMWRAQGVINVPLTDTIKARFGFDTQKRVGWLKNYSGVGPKDFADVDYYALRGSVTIDITSDIENYTTGYYSRSSGHGALSKVTDCQGSQYTQACRQIVTERAMDPFAVFNWLPDAYQDSDNWQAINTTTWKAADTLTIKNIVSYGGSKREQSLVLIPTGEILGTTFRVPSGASFVDVPVPARFIGKAIGSATQQSPPGLTAGESRAFTEELQFQGLSAGGNLTWQAGVYYERTKPVDYGGTSSMSDVICDDLGQWATFTCTDMSLINGSPRATGVRSYLVGQVNYRNVGLYAQGTYRLSPSLTVDAGIRYTWDKSWGAVRLIDVGYAAATGWNTPTFRCANPNLVFNAVSGFASCTEPGRSSSNAPTWLLGLNFKPTEDVLIYGKYTRGYRQGAYNPLGAPGFKNYEPEKVDVYEIGVKSSWRGAVPGSFNITAFYNDFRDMQLQVVLLDVNIVPPNYPISPVIVNAGKARIYGLEVEAVVSPFTGFNLQASYAYLNTKLVNFTPPDLSTQPVGGYNFIAATPKQGSWLQYTPNHKLALTASYTLPVPDSVGKIIFSGTYIYTGRTYYGENTFPAPTVSIFDVNDPDRNPSFQHGYGLTNLNVTWQGIGGSRIDASVFVTNLFDKRYFTSRTISSGATLRYYGEPRMYGTRFKVSF